MEWILIVSVLALLVYAMRPKQTAAKPRSVPRKEPTERMDEPDVLEAYESVRAAARNVVEIVNDDGVPEFKYRFRSNLSFDTPSEALRRHWQEVFIPRPNGNRDTIVEPGGCWNAVHEWDDPEISLRYEEEQFKYIGGVQVYIDLLLRVRAVYEDRSRSPAEKKVEIERICKDNYNVYTVRHVFAPPWESLLVPVLSLGEGIGPHRIGILETAGIKSIADIRARSDEQLLEIKGIGKGAVTALRNLAAQWVYDPDTEIIEKDSEYRRAVGVGYAERGRGFAGMES